MSVTRESGFVCVLLMTSSSASSSQDTQPPTAPQSQLQSTKYSPPIIAQAGEDWAQNLVRLARTAELKKHALTLQLHTAHILSAHAALQSKGTALQAVKEQKSRLESERTRLLDSLRELNEESEKANVLESSLSKECIDLRTRIQTITGNEYAQAKDSVDKLRQELGQSPIQSIQDTLNQREAAWLETVRKSKSQGQVGQPMASDGLLATTPPQMTPEAGPPITLGTNAKKRPASLVEQSPLAALNPTLDSTFAPSVKRPRGRPKGSKNKAKNQPSTDVVSPVSALLPGQLGAGDSSTGMLHTGAEYNNTQF